MNYTIRNAKLSDLDDIMKVEENSFIKPIQEARETFAIRIKNCPKTFFVFEQNNVFGYICGEFLSKEPKTRGELELNHHPQIIEEDLTQNRYFYISSFAILPEYRGSGLGKILWNKSLLKVKEMYPKITFYLLVNEEWKGALSIYEKSGFFKVQTFNSFFKTENDSIFTNGILMKK